MIELLIATRDTGPWKSLDVIAAVPLGHPRGRRELRPARGQQRIFAIVEVNDAALEASLRGKPKAAPYSDGNMGSTKRANVDLLNAAVKAVLDDPRKPGRIGTATIREKTTGEKAQAPKLPRQAVAKGKK